MRIIAYFMPFMPEYENVVSVERTFLPFVHQLCTGIVVRTGLHGLLRWQLFYAFKTEMHDFIQALK